MRFLASDEAELRDRNHADRRRRPQRLNLHSQSNETERNRNDDEVTTEQVEKVIFDGLAEVGAERDEISREATFEALDVDSLDLVELAQIVEDEFGVELEGDDLEGREDRRRGHRPGGDARSG